MFDAIIEAYRILEKIREKSKEIIVFYSGGKDSLVVMDMCSKVFSKVVPVFMYFVPGLKVIEEQLDFARERWGTEIVQIPHWSLIGALKYGAYSHSRPEFDDLPELRVKDCYHVAMAKTGISFVATGAKASDSQWRKRNLKATESYEFLVVPLKNWNKYDVLYYLKKENIPIPDSSGGNATGISLVVPEVLWLHDKHYEDFLKMERLFPFVRAIVKRRDYYGIK
jgi:3'-phosphoadenosine 5'-phosphosulfate sulfotransferase (PAPS reductase)/FAD synthetase